MTVVVSVYSGSTASGAPVRSISAPRLSGDWFITESSSLPAGTYTARAEQADDAGNVGYSAPLTFTITSADVTAPNVSLGAVPASSGDTTPTFSGTAGTLADDSSLVTVRVYSGSSVGGTLTQSLSVARNSAGSYSVDAATLAPGTYTARAEQSDAAGNYGYSAPVSFTITGADTVAPVVSLDALPSSTTDTTPVLSGSGGTASGDTSTVTVRLYPGSTASGTAVQSLNAARAAGGAYSVEAATLCAGHLHGARRAARRRRQHRLQPGADVHRERRRRQHRPGRHAPVAGSGLVVG